MVLLALFGNLSSMWHSLYELPWLLWGDQSERSKRLCVTAFTVPKTFIWFMIIIAVTAYIPISGASVARLN